MSTISGSPAAGGPSSTAVRSNFERLQWIVATAVPIVGWFLIINTLHATKIFVPGGAAVTHVVPSHEGHLILFYCASLLIGGFLSDYFNSWILFLVTAILNGLLTDLLNGNVGVIVLLYLSLDVIAWLTAAKCIRKCIIPPSQQRLWWTLLTACSSINFHLMIELFGLSQYIFNVITIGLSTLQNLLVLLPIGYFFNEQLIRSNDQEVTLKQLLRQAFFTVKSYKFWFIVVLNTLLMVTQWSMLGVPSTYTSKEKKGILLQYCILQ